MKLGVCTSIEGLADAAAAGFDFAEMPVSSLALEKGEADFAAIRQGILSAPIRVEVFNCFLPGSLKVTGPAVDLEAVRRHMEAALRRAAEAGAAIMVFGSGGARSLPEGFSVDRGWSQLAEAARLAADIAVRNKMTVVMEPLFKQACNLFNRVEQGAVLVDRIGHPRLRLLADMFHMAREQEPFDDIAAAGERLAHIHLAMPSIPEMAEGVAYDFPGFFAALRQAGYDGRVSVEDNPGLLAKRIGSRLNAYRAVREYLAPFCRG
ncbi:MAG: sugar phosphate isomerase/epimerase [Verrucomicrobia bacterium]|nr:sugar phosphate isomerase/epimerase [Verrucomicrobiota bacterium]MBU4498393.1 sugar phosphate isomerase/epimerase [Verrucomicrobiota bacterium]MCG2681836.1 sugar phosphate isomerase/epimerase [Kiritimatiellia bacterium]